MKPTCHHSLSALRSTLQLVAAISVTGMLLTACATSSQQSDQVEALFLRADANNDGKVSQAEFTDLMITEAFALYDPSGTGFITRESFISGGGSPERFNQIARGRDRFSLQQAKSNQRVRDHYSTPFREADVSNTGYLTLAEFRAYQQRARPYTRGM